MAPENIQGMKAKKVVFFASFEVYLLVVHNRSNRNFRSNRNNRNLQPTLRLLQVLPLLLSIHNRQFLADDTPLGKV